MVKDNKTKYYFIFSGSLKGARPYDYWVKVTILRKIFRQQVESIKQCFKNMKRQLLEISGQTAEYAGKVQGSTRAQILRGAVGRCLAS